MTSTKSVLAQMTRAMVSIVAGLVLSSAAIAEDNTDPESSIEPEPEYSATRCEDGLAALEVDGSPADLGLGSAGTVPVTLDEQKAEETPGDTSHVDFTIDPIETQGVPVEVETVTRNDADEIAFSTSGQPAAGLTEAPSPADDAKGGLSGRQVRLIVK